jgi:peptidoglycan/LPS O-acetylase OafA/YrhL
MWYSQRVHLQVVYLVLGAAFTLMLIRFLAADPAAGAGMGAERGRWGGLIRLLGLSSYPTYLFHGPIVMLTGSVLMRWRLVDDWRITCAILAAVGISSGVVLGHVAERPLMTWRAGYLKRLRQSHTGAARAGAPIFGIQQ